MELLTSFFAGIRPAVPMGVAIAALALGLFAVNYVFEKRLRNIRHRSFRRQLMMLLLSLVGLLIVIVVSPLSDAQKGQLLSLIGIVLSAAIALSSTTFLGNAMAGVMLRAVRSFRMGDFIKIGDHFGRVSERGLFHTEIQTEDRDLMTLPNLYLVTNPVKVVRSSGTIVTADVSLGYNVPRTDVEEILIEAALAAGLVDPFLLVMELGDYSVKYRIAGLLVEIKQVISARSQLREQMLDKLHAANVEIVSPTFMNTRAITEEAPFIPEVIAPPPDAVDEVMPETLAFDKAEEAESTEKLDMRRKEIIARIEEQEQLLKQAATDEEKERITKEIDQLKVVSDRIGQRVEEKTKELEE